MSKANLERNISIKKDELKDLISKAFDAGAMYQGALMSGLQRRMPQLSKWEFLKQNGIA